MAVVAPDLLQPLLPKECLMLLLEPLLLRVVAAPAPFISSGEARTD